MRTKYVSNKQQVKFPSPQKKTLITMYLINEFKYQRNLTPVKYKLNIIFVDQIFGGAYRRNRAESLNNAKSPYSIYYPCSNYSVH